MPHSIKQKKLYLFSKDSILSTISLLSKNFNNKQKISKKKTITI